MRIALRLLLALLLVLNGIGSVAAATRMAITAPVAAAATSQHCETAQAGDDNAADAVALMHHDAAEHGGASDHSCCGSHHACDCACVQAVSTAVLPPLLLPLTFQREIAPAPLTARHSAPALPSPLRPPIA